MASWSMLAQRSSSACASVCTGTSARSVGGVVIGSSRCASRGLQRLRRCSGSSGPRKRDVFEIHNLTARHDAAMRTATTHQTYRCYAMLCESHPQHHVMVRSNTYATPRHRLTRGRRATYTHHLQLQPSPHICRYSHARIALGRWWTVLYHLRLCLPRHLHSV
jgi:hypothetical protein